MIRAKGELIRFATRDGLLLDGFLIPTRKRDACVIHIHGMTGNFYGGNLQFAIASQLDKKGIALLTINTRGHDAISSAYRTQAKIKKSKAKRLSLGTNLERFEDCVLDIDGAIKELKKLGYKRFVLSGHSTGCQKIIYYQYKKKQPAVKGLMLLAPGDDYNAQKRDLGTHFDTIVSKCKWLIKAKEGGKTEGMPRGFSARRFLSVSDLKNAEARLFDYDGPLKEVGSIKAPMLAIFGSRDETAIKPVKKYMETLKSKRAGKPFSFAIIRGAKHSFGKHEDDVAKIASKWAADRLGKA
jgi:alpha-beta hydrolase superfamily lysophospholipase